MTRYIKSNLGRFAGVAVLTATLGLAGCDLEDILTVEDPETVNPETLLNPDVIDVVIAGALGDFTSGFSSGDSYVTVSALITDEFFSSGSFPTRTATDQRDQFRAVEGNTSDDAYTDLQFARRSLKDVAELVAANEDYGTTSDEYQELKALEGYTKILLGEGFCSAVPLSYVDDSGEFVYGQPLTSASVLDSAVATFDQALAGGESNLASVGKARALVDLAQSPADYQAAAAEVSGIPTEWVYYVYHSQTGISNTFFGLQGNGRYSMADRAAGAPNGALPFLSGCQVEDGAVVNEPCDPRTPWWEDPAGGFTPTIPLYRSLKYDDYDAPIVLASGVEARLIEAEADFEAGDFAGMTATLNELRADVATLIRIHVPDYPEEIEDPSLPALAVPATRAEALDQLFSERAFWLYLTGHRLGDARRLVYQKGVAEDDAYPSGSYHKGGLLYGDDVVFPLDFDEAVNENFDHEMCVVTSADIR